MADVNIPIGSPLAAKLFGAAVFSGVQHAPGFMNLLSGAAPQQGAAESKLKGQTSPDYPVVKVTDLAASPGTRVSVDLFNILTGKPVMGDKRIAGRGMSSSTSSLDIDINRSRGMSDNGGKIVQKRTRHNLRTIIRAQLTGWAQRLEDQRCLVQIAGARGSQNTTDWVIPPSTDPEFSEIMVNPVKAPTKNRRFFANGAATSPTSIAAMDNTCVLTLGDIDRIGSTLKESQVPLQQIVIKDDPYAWNSPLWVMFVTQRQWVYMKRCAGSVWQTAVTQAVKRFDGQRHPLFMGDSIMWNGILVKPFDRYAIRFLSGDSVVEDTGGVDGGTYMETTVTVPTAGTGVVTPANFQVDRAFIVGAQALIKAYGSEETSDYYYSWNEELVDHKSAVEVSLSMMEGTIKTRFRVNGVDTDHGVAIVDSYAPPLGTAESAAALALTKA